MGRTQDSQGRSWLYALEHNEDKSNRLGWLKYATNRDSGAKNDRN